MRRRGFTLVELVISIGILSLLGTTAFFYIIRASKDNQKLESQSVVQRDLNLTIDRVTRVLRSATIIISAGPTAIRVRGYPNTGDVAPSEIYFYISGSKVLYDVIPPTGQPPSYTYNQADAKTYTLLPKVTNNADSTPLFRYYDASNNLLTVSPTLAQIRTVEFLPSAQDTKNLLTAPIKAQTIINFRNFKNNL